MKNTKKSIELFQKTVTTQFRFFSEKRDCFTRYLSMEKFDQNFLDMVAYSLIDLGLVVYHSFRVISNLFQLAFNLIICNPTAAVDNAASGAIDFSSALIALVMIPIVPVIAAAAIIMRLFVTIICSCHPWSLLEGESIDSFDKNSLSTQFS